MMRVCRHRLALICSVLVIITLIILKQLYNQMLIRQEKERAYYTPRASKVNPITADFIIHGDKICKSAAPFLLMMIPSIPNHFNVRKMIRNTYGSFAHSIYSDLNITMKTVFLLGQDEDKVTDSLVEEESKIYGDIVKADFQDSYNNLTRKMIIGLKWTALYCQNSEYLFKVDEDMFINIPVLVRFLKNHPRDDQGTIYGHIHTRSEVRAKGKWAIEPTAFPLEQFPSYASGNAYVISGNAVRKLFDLSEYFPYISIEDAFITGILARVAQVKHVDERSFTTFEEKILEPCTFIRQNLIGTSRMTVHTMENFWKVFTHYKTYC